VDADTASAMLASIEANRLVVLCGAGLSMPSPSDVPSAKALANHVTDSYKVLTGSSDLDPHRDSLEAVADYFLQRNELVSILIRTLVDWRPFRGHPNAAHFCLADFLGAHAVRHATTTNFDELTELAARQLGERDFRSALDGDQAAAGGQGHAPYLKVHGCVNRDIDHTLWCRGQLVNGEIAARLSRSATWLAGNLLQRDVVVVGFWSDWKYLIDVLQNCLNPSAPASVTIVDPKTNAELAADAPALWAWAHKGHFRHVQESALTFLDELRRLFSLSFLRRMMTQAAPTHAAWCGHPYAGPQPDALFAAATTADLFALRQDAAGAPVGEMPRLKRPDAGTDMVAAMQMLLAENGAVLDGSLFVREQKRIRIVRGGGQALSLIKASYLNEAGTPEPVDIIVAAGAEDDGGAAANIVREGAVPNVVRPGAIGRWVTFQQARQELGV